MSESLVDTLIRALRRPYEAQASPVAIPLTGNEPALLSDLSVGEISGEGPNVCFAETLYAGVWRCLSRQDSSHQWLEVGIVPCEVAEMSRDVVNPGSGLLEDWLNTWARGQGQRSINLTVLDLPPEATAGLDELLGAAVLQIDSHAFGRCRATAFSLPGVWRVCFYNAQQAISLDTLEFALAPEVIAASKEDMQDSLERLEDALACN